MKDERVEIWKSKGITVAWMEEDRRHAQSSPGEWKLGQYHRQTS